MSAIAVLALASCQTILFNRTIPNRIPLYARMAPEAPLRAGAAEADITPDGSVYMGGYGLNRTSQGVHQPLKARALVIEKGGFKLAFVGVDLLGMHFDDVEWIKQSIPGFPLGNVLICCTHTHAGPDLMGLWGFYFFSSGRDEAVLDKVRRGVRDAVLLAEQRLVPVTARVGQAWIPNEGVAKNNNRPGLFDHELTVLLFERADGRRAGTLINYGCHPEVMRRDNRLLSSDIAGALCDAVTADTGATAVFLNGALGAMVTPSRPYGAKGMPPHRDRLLGLVREAETAARPLAAEPLTVRRTDVFLPVDNRGYHLSFQLGLFPRQLWQGHVRTTVGVFEIGPLRAASVPGEIEPNLAGRIKAQLGGAPSLVFALADDELGYLMAREDAQLPTFDYERTLTPCDDAGDRLARAVLDLSRAGLARPRVP